MPGSDAAVVLWGAKSSGKSGFLGALWHVDQELTDAEIVTAVCIGDIARADGPGRSRIGQPLIDMP